MSEWIKIRIKDFYKDAIGEVLYSDVQLGEMNTRMLENQLQVDGQATFFVIYLGEGEEGKSKKEEKGGFFFLSQRLLQVQGHVAVLHPTDTAEQPVKQQREEGGENQADQNQSDPIHSGDGRLRFGVERCIVCQQVAGKAVSGLCAAVA